MHRKIILFAFTFLLIFGLNLRAQEDFYAPSVIREVKIYFSQPDWDFLLDSLFEAGQQERILATVCIDGTCFDSAGVRYKGYSSVDTDQVKNPFNIDLDYMIPGQEYLGVSKLKLGNVIHDPSFVREVLSYEIARQYMPASKANYANVYVNDTLIGLYTSIESINKPWAGQHFGNDKGAFFKGDPAVLEYPFGSNANLEYYDTDSASYYPYYSLESDSGWADLVHLCDILNHTPDSIANVLNIDRVLWMLAFDYALVNLDSYIAYAQNYYIYQDVHGRFNPILWDLNMSFGSFRLSDGSTAAMMGGLTIAGAKNLNPLGLLTFAISPRPMATKLLSQPQYKRMYMAHIRTIVQENFLSGTYYTRGKELQQIVESSVLADTNRFYSYADFVKNIDSLVGGSGNMIDYPGIKDLVQARSTYLGNYAGFQGAPVIETHSVSPQNPGPDDYVNFTVKISGNDTCFIAYRFNASGPFTRLAMYDDGGHNDGAANDSIFGVQVQMNGSMFQYYFYAENSVAGAFSPVRAEYEYYTISPLVAGSDLVINEIMAENESYIFDQDHEYDDWIEFYNNGDNEIDLSGVYLSDNLMDLNKWAFPDTSIPAHGYLIVWADENENQEGLHANFKLSGSGEGVFLTYAGITMIDSVSFGQQVMDWTWGRYPNGTGPFGLMHASYSATNYPVSAEEISLDQSLVIWPNPASEYFICKRNGSTGSKSIPELFHCNGQRMNPVITETGEGEYRVDVSYLAPGLYILRWMDNDGVTIEKVVVN